MNDFIAIYHKYKAETPGFFYLRKTQQPQHQ